MAEIVYIDEEEGKKRLMNNGKLYAKILTKFKTTTNLNAFEASVDAQDWGSAQAAVHAIRGAAANLSLIELFNQTTDIETQIKGGSLKPDALGKLRLCFDETMLQAEKVIAQYA
jgi:HPt (histidine-containing phosphotransfer) domain-containing protein